MSAKRRKNNKILIIVLTIIFTLLLLIVLFTGFFVTQPILSSNINQNYTYWFIRINTGLPFISSADSLAIKKFKNSNPLSKSIVLVQTLAIIKDKKIARLPYIPLFHTLSMIGKK